MTDKTDRELESITVDISDLCGTYRLSEMPTILKLIEKRIDEAKNQDLIHIKRLVDISTRLKNSLIRAKFATLNEVCFYSKHKLRDFNGIGKASIIELEGILSRYDLQLKKSAYNKVSVLGSRN